MQLNYTNSVDPDDFKASILFKALEAAMQTDDDNLIEKVRGVYAFKVKNGPNGKEGYWIINAKTGKGSVEFNGKGKGEKSFFFNFSNVTLCCSYDIILYFGFVKKYFNQF